MEQQAKKWVIGGSILSLLAGSIYVISNQRTRTGVVDFFCNTTNQTKHWITVISDNHEAVLDQIRNSGEKITTVVEAASDDIQKLMESSQSMKKHAFDLFEAIQDTTDEMKELKHKLVDGNVISALPKAESLEDERE